MVLLNGDVVEDLQVRHYSAVIEPNIPVNTSEQACWSMSASRQLQLYNNLRYTYNKDNNVSICR